MAIAKRKRLPKELQDYKKEIKGLDFKERVKAYFNCAPYLHDLDGMKKDVIVSSFSKTEREEFFGKYIPIHNSIERYGDRIRAIHSNSIIYNNYISAILKQRDTILYNTDLINIILPKVAKALEGTKEADTASNLEEALSAIRSYKTVLLATPRISLNKKGTAFEVYTKEEDNVLKGLLDNLKSTLSLLKCYLESLKEFLEWVGTPELLPKEFSDMENGLLSRYRPLEIGKEKNKQADKYPLFFSESEIVKEFFSIDYENLKLSIDILGENNLFANSYRRFFNY